FDILTLTRPAAAFAGVRCRDADDQIFIDLAVAHRANLLSTDAQILALRHRLASLGVAVASVWMPMTPTHGLNATRICKQPNGTNN
ncbi:MAG: PIN domain-containing protein, partial [Burkholderiaceae bacterium]|nr:PIN domain-containing protein [Burkholderiaceae bacterium]